MNLKITEPEEFIELEETLTCIKNTYKSQGIIASITLIQNEINHVEGIEHVFCEDDPEGTGKYIGSIDGLKKAMSILQKHIGI